MFKRIAQKLLPSKSQTIGKIRIEYGELLAQDDCEAVLFFMRPRLDWGGALNRAVLERAGKALDDHILDHVDNPKSGDVYELPPFDTGYKAIYLAILADWDGGIGFEERDLLNCYRRAVSMAQSSGIRTMAIPAMGRDKRDFPHIRFARLTLQGIMDRLNDGVDYIKIMCIDRTMMATYNVQLEKLKKRG